MTAVNIDTGSMPDFNKQINNPELFNMFIGKSGSQYILPSLDRIGRAIPGTLKVHFTNFDGGRYIVVTELNVYRVSPTGAIAQVGTVQFNSQSVVEVTENLQNQVTIVGGGIGAYVLDQNADTFLPLTVAQGFALNNPISCTTLNSFTVVLDASGQWQISNPNAAYIYSAIQIQQIDSQLVTPLAVRTNDNNLFIFGTAGIERWEPTFNVQTYLFPLQKDQDFKNNFGGLNTSLIESDINYIFFLSSRYMPMTISRAGIEELGNDGIAKVFSEYPDALKGKSSIYTYLSNYFFQITLEESKKTWVYCFNSKKWSNSNDLIIDSTASPSVSSGLVQEVVALRDGIYNLTSNPTQKRRRWVSDRFNAYKGQMPSRGLLNGVEIMITQGENIFSILDLAQPEYIELSVSVDNITFGNALKMPIGSPGQTQYRTRFPTNMSGTFFTLKLEYFGSLNYTVEGVDAIIN